MSAKLIRIDWPDHGTPEVPPSLELPEMAARLAATRAAMATRGLDALVVYGDREHFANLHWVTGFDPRFEEALLILRPDQGLLVAGNECLPYTGISPLVRSGVIEVAHCASFSLISQPRYGERLGDILYRAVPPGAKVGAAGWKYFGADEMEDPEGTLDLPAFIADSLRQRAGQVVNATDLFMHPGHGLRARVDVADIARLEFANHMAAAAMLRMVFRFREGISDFEAFASAQVGGLPLGCHATFATGSRAAQGLSSPTGERLVRGSPISFNICHWGANICRAGWLATGPDDLPEPARDYLGAFVFPYVEALSRWCSLMVPGANGGGVWQQMVELLPPARFGVELNPGHLIGMDEWLSSPIGEGSFVPLASGMAMQSDVIPVHPVYGSTRMEDGYVIADSALRAELERRFPAVAARCASRARFMREVIGMELPETLLPLADTCGVLAPWLLDPGQVVTLR